MRWISILGVGLLGACSGETLDDTGTGGTMMPPNPTCDSTLATIEPAANATEVSADTSVTATFDTALIDGGTWSLAIDGVDGAATLAEDRLSATFVPDAPLDFETVYNVNVTVCEEMSTFEFLTGAAPVDATNLEGATFTIAEEEITITNPALLQTVLAGLDQSIFNVIALQLTTYDAATSSFDAVTTVLDEEDAPVCEFLVAGTTDFSANPFLSFGPQDLTIDIGGGASVTLEDLVVEGRVAPDGQSLTNTAINTLIALETVPISLGGLDELPSCPDAVKNPVLGALLMPVCAPCDTSPSGECLVFEATAKSAARSLLDVEKACPPE
ncbi:MAG: Ig-like domain-containing protein [Myxococcota bacterium]